MGESDRMSERSPAVAEATLAPAEPLAAVDTAAVDPLPHVFAGFSFVDPAAAGMPLPGRYGEVDADLQYVAEQGITLLFTLTESPLDEAAVAASGLDVLHLPIPDMHAPTLEQQQRFVAVARERVARGEAFGAHCLYGMGRTGTLLATWFVAEGLAPDAAIAAVRAARPGSIETTEQEEAVYRFAASLR